MKDRLASLITTHGLKHWSFALRRDAEFMSWVDQKTSHLSDDVPFAGRVYAAVNDDMPECSRGNVRKFDNIERGWRFCGGASKCACAKESVARKVSQTKRAATDEQKHETNAKRAATNQERYGAANIGQSQNAREAHRAFYAQPEKVVGAISKGRETMLARYGVDNALKLPEVSEARRTLAGRLTPEQKQSKSKKQKLHALNGGYLRKAHARLKAYFRASGYDWITPFEAYTGVYGSDGREKFEFKCLQCEHSFQSHIYDGHRPMCPSCFPRVPSYTSGEENSVADYLSGLGLKVVRPGRSVLGSFELDMYLPDIGVAVDYGGLYWHSEFASQKGPEYHLSKLEACESKGIRLITMFSDEWLLQRSLVENRLAHIVGVQGERAFARKTVCRAISSSDAATFLNTHHIQGAGTPASVRYGLFQNDALCAVMTFGPLRKNNNRRHVEHTWELYRFASRGQVIGGASKLFKAFVAGHEPQVVETYADRRWGTGNVYRHMGFVANGSSAPGYWWVEKYVQRHHRFHFTKHKLVEAGYDVNKTEVEIMLERKFDRIWDCGQLKFIWRK